MEVTRQLARTLKERHVHEFCPGRETERLASDDLNTGQRRLENTSRIKDFVEHTILDAGAIHNPKDEDLVPNVITINSTPVEVPHMVIDGEFVVGDSDENELYEDEVSELADLDM